MTTQTGQQFHTLPCGVEMMVEDGKPVYVHDHTSWESLELLTGKEMEDAENAIMDQVQELTGFTVYNITWDQDMEGDGTVGVLSLKEAE